MFSRRNELELELGERGAGLLWVAVGVLAVVAACAVAFGLFSLYVIAALLEALAELLEASQPPGSVTCDQLAVIDHELWRAECLTTG